MKQDRLSFISCIIDDGLCFVQPILAKDSVVGHASSTEIGQAAHTMLQACVIERGMGGLAFNLGKSEYHVISPLAFRHRLARIGL